MSSQTDLNNLYNCFRNLRDAAACLEKHAIEQAGETSELFDWASSLRSLLQDITHSLKQAQSDSIENDNYYDDAVLCARILEAELVNCPV